MMDDLVARLRAPAYWFSESDEGHPGENSAPREAADRIEALAADRDAWRANAERLAEALRPFAKSGEIFKGAVGEWEVFDQCIYSPAAGDEYSLCGDDLRRARDVFAAHAKLKDGAA